jgi:hypothetical protein
MTTNTPDALFQMESEICDLRGARAALSKLAEGCADDSEMQDALFWISGMIAGTGAELQRLWELATDRKPGRGLTPSARLATAA